MRGVFTHSVHELNWTPHGRFKVTTGARTWTVTSANALWVPAGVPHRVKARSDDVILPLRFPHAPDSPDLRATARIRVTDRLETALWRMVESQLSPRFDRGRTREEVLTLLPTLTYPRLELPVPTQEPAATVARALRDRPDSAGSIEDWATELGLSSRTILRGFKEQTGWSFSEYKVRARVIAGLDLLGEDRTIGQVAREVGYTSASFVSAFRRIVGTSPSAFLQQGLGSEERLTPTRARADADASRIERELQQNHAARFASPEDDA